MKSNFLQRALTVCISVAIVGGFGPPATATGPTSSDFFAELEFDSVAGFFNATLNEYGVKTQVASNPGSNQYVISALTFQGEDNYIPAMITQGPAPSVNATPVTLQGSAGSYPLVQSFNASALSGRTEARIRVCFQVQYENSTLYQVCSAPIVNGGAGSGGNTSTTTAPAPAKYSGPELSGLSAKPVMNGSSTTLTGKRLTQVSSIEIGGKAATFTATSDTELSLTPAADLAPGTYDLVINSAAGKLTHINAVRIQPALRSFSVTTRAENRVTEEHYQEHSLIASMQQSELTKARCIVNGPNLAQAKAQAERLCALVKAANPNIETTVIDPRSTVKNNTVFARVTYGWN